MSDTCAKQQGYVIFDVICLMASAAEVRAALTAEVAEEIAEAAKPVLSKLEQYIVTISAEESMRALDEIPETSGLRQSNS